MRAGVRIAAVLGVVTATAFGASVATGEEVGGGPDETPAQAQPIAQNKVVAGAFQGSQDYFDYYSFQAQAGQTLTFTLKDTTGSCSGTNDPYQDGCPVYGWLADAANQQLGGPNSAAGGNTSVGRNGAYPQQSSWAWTFSQTGTYYIGLTDDEGPAIPAGTPSYTIEFTVTSPGTTAHHRTISLSVKRGVSSLTFKGQLGEVNGFSPCTGDQPVEVQRRSGTGWLTIAHAMTGAAQAGGIANYGASASGRPGTYRAVAPQTTAGQANICDQAVSKSVAVNVAKHPRKAVLTGVRQVGNRADVHGYVKATDGFERCARHVPVIAQRQVGGRWIKVGSGRTGDPNARGRAAFNISVPLRSGSYRALVPFGRVDALDACLKATSGTEPGPPGH